MFSPFQNQGLSPIEPPSESAQTAAAPPENLSDSSKTAAAPCASDPTSPSVVICFKQSAKEITCDDKISILEIAEQADIEIESSCQSGACGTCKHKLLEGDVTYEGDPIALEESEQAQGFILTCIARPVGRVVVDV